ncbi:MAG TPA: hypothetical protein VFV63_03250 [Ilumatobacteraceae bacterium]|nr:hypothetical protein [Ilumatobacteraceae bacterium]
MRIPTRDKIATVLVALAVVVYVLWGTGSALPGMDGVRVTGLVVLVLGFVASASAVVPGFDELWHGSKLYLAGTSLIGLVAFAGGVVMLVGASEVALGVVMAAMILLWMIATIHHAVLAEAGTASGYRAPRTPTHGQRPAGVS